LQSYCRRCKVGFVAHAADMSTYIPPPPERLVPSH
jgi:hypothetical protein